jgi:hypothetical protein
MTGVHKLTVFRGHLAPKTPAGGKLPPDPSKWVRARMVSVNQARCRIDFGGSHESGYLVPVRVGMGNQMVPVHAFGPCGDAYVNPFRSPAVESLDFVGSGA